LDNETPWRHEAACSGADTEIFYPPRDKVQYKRIADIAKGYCNGPNGNSPCPVRAECLWSAIESDELHGIWGGMSHRERNALVRKWQRKFKGKMSLKEFVLSEETRVDGYKQLGT
jgi:WhiB family transcriptional regulator, redox-sensing transcriptional regulator